MSEPLRPVPVHATLRRATRLVCEFRVNDAPFATALYHPDRTEWLDHP